MRLVAVLVAAALLNIGLYFILFFIAPIIAGLVCGIVVRDLRKGFILGYLGSFVAYFPLFIIVEWIYGSTFDIFIILVAACIISILGGVGGFLSAFLIRRNLN